MKNILVLAIIVGVAWFGYSRYKSESPIDSPVEQSGAMSLEASAASFKCDGRTMCSQMTSCAEATHFVQHCPNTKMDGDGDGVPCERQWCN